MYGKKSSREKSSFYVAENLLLRNCVWWVRFVAETMNLFPFSEHALIHPYHQHPLYASSYNSSAFSNTLTTPRNICSTAKLSLSRQSIWATAIMSNLRFYHLRFHSCYYTYSKICKFWGNIFPLNAKSDVLCRRCCLDAVGISIFYKSHVSSSSGISDNAPGIILIFITSN